MSYIIVGLGNPGEDYEGTRHNAGRMAVEKLAKTLELEWDYDKKLNAKKAEGKIGKEKVILLLPEGLMNNSGKSLGPIVTSKKQAEKLIIAHDDLDLPLGKLKLSWNRSSGGHRGIESIIRHLKTSEFLRVRIGVCPTTPSGKLKKPVGEEKVIDFILAKFRPAEEVTLKKVIKSASEAMATAVSESREQAMTLYNR